MTVASNILLGAHFDSAFVFDWLRDSGPLTPAFSYGAPSIVAAKFSNGVQLGNPAAADGAYWNSPGILSGLLQTGCISFWVRPHFTGLPPATQYFFEASQYGYAINRIELYLNSGGGFRFYVRNGAGGSMVTVSGAWSPTAETWYHWEANFDITAGASRLFIDGVQVGATSVATGVRTATTDAIGIGLAPGSAPVDQNFDIDELLVYEDVQHVAGFVPPALPVDLTYSVLANLSFEDPESVGGVDAQDWPDVWLPTATSASLAAGLFGSPSRWVESFEGRWSSNQDSVDAFVPATHLTQGIFGAWPYERIYEGFERDWSANEGSMSSFSSGDIQAGVFDAAGDVIEDFEQEWPSRHFVADTSTSISVAVPAHGSLPELIIRLNEIKAAWNTHIADTSFHAVADVANAITSPDASNLASAIDLAEEIWNNRIWDHIVDGSLTWHMADSVLGMAKSSRAALDVVTTQDEAWEVAVLASVECNLHLTWASCSGPGNIAAFEELSMTPANPFAVLVSSAQAEDFEADWSSNDTSLSVFAPGDISAGDFVTNTSPNQYEGFEELLSMAIVLSSSSAGAALNIDASDGVRVSFGGTLTGSLRLEARRKAYGSWITVSDVDTLPVAVDVDAGFKQLRVYTVAYSAGAPTATQQFAVLDTL